MALKAFKTCNGEDTHIIIRILNLWSDVLEQINAEDLIESLTDLLAHKNMVAST